MKAKLKPDEGIQDSEKMNKIRINKTVSMYYISWLGKSRRFELYYFQLLMKICLYDISYEFICLGEISAI